MKLYELIESIIDNEKLEAFYFEKKFNLNSEEISIYMENSIDLDSNIFFFEVEDTDGEVVYEKEGVSYFYFFPLEHTTELIVDELELKEKGLSNIQIAERLFEYRIYDA